MYTRLCSLRYHRYLPEEHEETLKLQPHPRKGTLLRGLEEGPRGVLGLADDGDPEAPISMVQVFPVQAGMVRLDGERTYQYWPFSTSDLYNWKTPTPSFSEKPQGLIDLLESILFTHSPTWDDCQQLLQVLFTAEECERILSEARKNVPGVDRRPMMQPNLIDEGFPLTQHPWDFECTEGMECLRVFHQTHGWPLSSRQETNKFGQGKFS